MRSSTRFSDRKEPTPKGLDAGIATAVDVLMDYGVETYESCEGGNGHSYPEPTVRFHGQPEEGFRAYAAAMERGLPVAALRRVWVVVDGELSGPHWEMTFAAKLDGAPAQRRYVSPSRQMLAEACVSCGQPAVPLCQKCLESIKRGVADAKAGKTRPWEEIEAGMLKEENQ